MVDIVGELDRILDRVTHPVRRGGAARAGVGGVKVPPDEERVIELAALGDRLSALRLCEASALELLRRSLARHGQLSPLSVFADGEQLEVIDGFKRVHAARMLGWQTLRVSVASVDAVDAKVHLLALHDRHGLTELEEGWLIRSLYRDDALSQPAIAQRLGRHKSWVFRRLLLIEALDPAVQADVRLGLLAARTAVLVSRLPRGNQHAAAGLVIRRGLTVRQTELVVAELLDCADDTARAEQLARWMNSLPPGAQAADRVPRAARKESDWITADIHTLRQTAARLSARLLATPLLALGPDAAALITESLTALTPVLHALQGTLTKACGHQERKEKDAA
jgi:ParB/RepB/Spo0J family partition protein